MAMAECPLMHDFRARKSSGIKGVLWHGPESGEEEEENNDPDTDTSDYEDPPLAPPKGYNSLTQVKTYSTSITRSQGV